MLWISSLTIDNIGPIKSLSLVFDRHLNVICGGNGVGKSTILDIVSQAFSSSTDLKRRADSISGSWKLAFETHSGRDFKNRTLENFLPTKISTLTNKTSEAHEIVVFKTHRDIVYSQVVSVNLDPRKDKYGMAEEARIGVQSNGLKDWLVARYMWSAHENGLTKEQRFNLDLSLSFFALLDNSISFFKIESSSHELLVRTLHGTIYYEYLSSGFKSCLAVLLGIVKEIEYRGNGVFRKVSDFEGVLIIDELDLHLHPEWQARILTILREVLPKAQIIVSTHSPHILQVCSSNEIMPLVRVNDEVQLNAILKANPFGCQGWTVEEILTDVMGMKETRSEAYLEKMDQFNLAMDEENFGEARKIFETIDIMLHPNNVLRKLLRIQLAGTEEDDKTQ